MIKVLGTGSKGNCYLIQAKDETLILELGISLNGILKGLNFNLSNVVGCLVSHHHKDHCVSLKKANERGLNIYTSKDVINKFSLNDFRRVTYIEALKKFKVGNFTILPFDCNHTNNDGEKCLNLGFLIQHDELGKILFATDTYYLKYTFKDIDHVLIECNYTERDLDKIPPYRARVLKSHMSLETLKETFENWDLSKTKDVTLIHLSETNGDPKLFKEEIEKVTGCIVNIAVAGLEIRQEW